MSETDATLRKAEFELHVAHITETHKALIDNAAKVAGFLLLALGWLATSTEARAFLGSTPRVAVIAALAVAAAYLLSAVASWIAYRACQRAMARLRELDYLPPASYEARRISLPTLLACVLGNGAISALLVAALLSLPLARAGGA